MQPGDYYTIVKTDPAGYSHTPYGATPNTIGNYVSSLGVTLTAPAGTSKGTLVSTTTIADIMLPVPKAGLVSLANPFGPNASGGKYAAMNYNFGLVGQGPAIPSLTTSLALVGTNDRLLAGPGGTLALSGTVKLTGESGFQQFELAHRIEF